MSKRDWENVISPAEGDYTERLRVPGGWLYRTWFMDVRDQKAVAMVFVPELADGSDE